MAYQTCNRVDLATEQLDDAISLLERERFVSALTLAGTAEEILGKMLSHRGEANFLDCKYKVLGPIRTRLDRMPLSKEDFIRDENRALITITHIASTSTPSVTLDLEDAAHSMIVRALCNYDALGLPRTARMLEFRNRYREYVVEYVVSRTEEAKQAIQTLRDAAKERTSQTAECVVIDGQECFVIERASTNVDSGAK
jgi:hypothetical protein